MDYHIRFIKLTIALVSTHEILVMKSILVVLTDKQVPKIYNKPY